jgi:hypothetical protein
MGLGIHRIAFMVLLEMAIATARHKQAHQFSMENLIV